MPIIYQHSWTAQYFEHVKCPKDVSIPTEDWNAWPLFQEHRWVYDKLAVALSQGLEAGLHGVMPPSTSYPVFSKPITSLMGMGAGSRIIPNEDTFRVSYQPGHFWSTLLTGRHVSTDAAILDGEMVWCRHATGVPIVEGMFDYWHIHKEVMPEIEGWCGDWSRKHLAGYTGMVNFETIGGRIIEVHLRFANQWPDLYGDGWMDAVIRLYSEKQWNFEDNKRTDQYSVILWGSHGQCYRHPLPSSVNEARAVHGVMSIQITFDENADPLSHFNPPGGFRLGIVNATDLEAARKAIEILRGAIKDMNGNTSTVAVPMLLA
ncbi:hypothetical protein B0O80DRAFT_118716 [Mortierella sp. GBAus27b]|nr:hypothetical protein B0O80DRAFT_118716 [Mortierella sp. GBAus27b]